MKVHLICLRVILSTQKVSNSTLCVLVQINSGFLQSGYVRVVFVSAVFFTYANALPNRKALHAQLHCANPNETMGCEPIIAEYHQTRSALVETSPPGESWNQASKIGCSPRVAVAETFAECPSFWRCPLPF